MKKQRKHYTPEEKVAILRRHLVKGVPISDLCDERGLQPTVFYRSAAGSPPADLQVERNDHLLLPTLQPKIPGNPAVALTLTLPYRSRQS